MTFFYLFTTCSWLFHDLFINLLMTCRWLVYDLLWLVHDLFTTCSKHVHDLFMTYSLTYSWHFYNLFTWVTSFCTPSPYPSCSSPKLPYLDFLHFCTSFNIFRHNLYLGITHTVVFLPIFDHSSYFLRPKRGVQIYLAQIDGSAQNLIAILGPLATILDFAVVVALQAVSECPRLVFFCYLFNNLTPKWQFERVWKRLISIITNQLKKGQRSSSNICSAPKGEVV